MTHPSCLFTYNIVFFICKVIKGVHTVLPKSKIMFFFVAGAVGKKVNSDELIDI